MSFLMKRLMEPEKVTVILDKVAEGLGLKMFKSFLVSTFSLNYYICLQNVLLLLSPHL